MNLDSSPKLVPIWQRPSSYHRGLPHDWRSPEAISGAERMRRPSRIWRALSFAGKVLLAVIFFFLLNLAFSPELWEALR